MAHEVTTSTKDARRVEGSAVEMPAMAMLAMDLDGRTDDLARDHLSPGLGRRLSIPHSSPSCVFVVVVTSWAILLR
jgi:hypothetical protein